MQQHVTASKWQVPRLDPGNRWIGGVASAIAVEIGVQPLVVRAAFVVLLTVGGWGLVIYALTWGALALAAPRLASTYVPLPKAATATHRTGAVVMITLGIVLALLPLTNAVFALAVWPVGFVLAGMLIAWSRSDEGGAAAVIRVVVGLMVTIGGFVAFAVTRVDIADAAISFSIALAVVSGVVLVAAPSIVRMGRDLDHERLERARSDERARINAHIHDSVLQTLTLIQQRVDDPTVTRQLARRQERELRSWLFGAPSTTAAGLRLRPALDHLAAEAETHGTATIDVVTVGDTDDLDGTLIEPLIAATREAMLNAVRHSGAERISVFAERRTGSIDLFVRDEGVGFDRAAVGDDRHGLADSIVARMERAGGGATIHTSPGSGTEIELSLPVEASVGTPT